MAERLDLRKLLLCAEHDADGLIEVDVVLRVLSAHPFQVAEALGIKFCSSCCTLKDAVLKLHPKRYPPFQGVTSCGTCSSPWPCDTAVALGAES